VLGSPGAVAVSILEHYEPVTSLVQGLRDLELSLRARTPDSVLARFLPGGSLLGPREGGTRGTDPRSGCRLGCAS
jgi:hypothetical protein